MQDDLEKLFHTAFMAFGDAALAIDQEGEVIAGNNAFMSLFGFDRGGWRGMSVDQLCAAADPERSSPSIAGPTFDHPPGRRLYRRADGTTFLGERSDAPISDSAGRPLGVVAIIREVGEPMLLHDGLASLLAVPAASAHHGMAQLIDHGCRYFDAEHGGLGRIEGDDLVVEMIGGTSGLHHVGEKLFLARTFAGLPHDQDGVLAIEHASLAGLAAHPYYRRTGVEVYYGSEVRVGGRIYGELCFADQAPEKRELQACDRLFLRLLAQWAGMLLEGRMTRTALRVAGRDLERFAHIASHDLQEPLRRVVTYCQILMEDFGAEVSDEAAEVIDIIQTGGKRLRLMLNDLLVYSRLNQQLHQDFEPVDMASILCQAMDDLAEKIETSGAQVNAAHLPLVWGNGPLLQRVCYHLISNGIKFAGELPPEIDISIQEQGGFWLFRVTDHGIGIEPRFAARIFDIFQRLHARDDFSGSGAGLAICKMIVERHGGAIWLDAACAEGTSFLFKLPKGRWAAGSALGLSGRLPPDRQSASRRDSALNPC